MKMKMKRMKMKTKIPALVLLAIFVILAVVSLTVFEDGSFMLELFRIKVLSGCLPGGICNL